MFGEDAITSVNLCALAAMRCPGVVVEDTRISESSKGCDFEFWVGTSAIGWARYAIQAKKLGAARSTYTGLAHRVAGRPQIDILDAYAKINRAAPLYCFYNYSPLPHGWHCSLPQDSEQLGCSVTPSHVVRASMRVRGSRSFQALHSHPATVPWRCLVRCQHLGTSPGLAHSHWPSPSMYVHAALPPHIGALLKHRGTFNQAEVPQEKDAEFGLKPRWIVIIEHTQTASDGG